MKNIKLILWDVDGVLFNSDELHFDLLSKLLKALGIELTSRFYGENGLDDCISELGLSEYQLTELRQEFRKVYYSDQILEKLKFKPDVKNLLSELHGNYRFAIASGEKKEQIERYLNHFEIAELFEFIGHGQLVEGRKSNPLYFEAIFSQLGIKKEETLFIGDSIFDTKAAEFGIKTVICPTMFTKFQTFPKNCKIIENIDEISMEI